MEQATNIPSLMATVHHSQRETLLWTLTLGSTTSHPMSFPETIIGRGHDNVGNFDDKGSSIVGIGGGAVSLVSQLSSSIGGKFSYCLVPLTSRDKNSSKLNFGSDAVVSGPGTMSTPLVPKILDTFHFLTLDVTPQTQKGSKHEKNI